MSPEPDVTARQRKKLPAWLVGLFIAAAVFVVVLLVFSALGYGDDPVIEGMVAIGGTQSLRGIGFPLQSMPSAGR